MSPQDAAFLDRTLASLGTLSSRHPPEFTRGAFETKFKSSSAMWSPTADDV